MPGQDEGSAKASPPRLDRFQRRLPGPRGQAGRRPLLPRLPRGRPRLRDPALGRAQVSRIDEAAFLRLVRGETRGVVAGAARFGLSAASGLYRPAVAARNLAFDRGWKPSHRAGVPVVSVGNLTLGGTGKTPMVEWIARWYRSRGVRVAILSRGYGQSGEMNDEGRVLEENLPDVPHLQGADRVDLAGRAAEELESELLVLDDGFQHRRPRARPRRRPPRRPRPIRPRPDLSPEGCCVSRSAR